MAIQASSSLPHNTETRSVENGKCWSWSIQPLVTWIRILGVDLPEVCSTSYQSRYRWWMTFYGIFCFAANALGQFEVFSFLHVLQTKALSGTPERVEEFDWTKTTILIYIIDFCNYSVNGIGTQIIFLVVIRSRWIDLMDIFQKSQVHFNGEHYSQIRKMSIIGIAYIIIVVKIFFKFNSRGHIIP